LSKLLDVICIGFSLLFGPLIIRYRRWPRFMQQYGDSVNSEKCVAPMPAHGGKQTFPILRSIRVVLVGAKA
jgi:hypothetical protein